MNTEELEGLNPLHYSPIGVDGGVLGPLFTAVHNHLLCLADVEGEIVVLAPYCQVTDLVVSCSATQSWVNREYRRELNTYP